MKRSYWIVAGIAVLGGCGPSDSGRSSSNPDAPPGEGGFSALVAAPGGEAASVGSYAGTVTFPDGRQFEISGERDGSLNRQWVTSLDGDERPELVLWMVGAGSGSYASIHLYRMTDEGPEMDDISQLPHGVMNGYMGHDRVWIENGRLRRCFPLFEPDDPNSEPSGDERCLYYDQTGLWVIE